MIGNDEYVTYWSYNANAWFDYIFTHIRCTELVCLYQRNSCLYCETKMFHIPASFETVELTFLWLVLCKIGRYVKIGNGNQLVRNPKRRARILANEKIRWSLHTARQRLAKKRKYCQFFTRFGKCNKEGGKCPYIHDTSKVAVCTKFLNGLCSNASCKLTHQVQRWFNWWGTLCCLSFGFAKCRMSITFHLNFLSYTGHSRKDAWLFILLTGYFSNFICSQNYRIAAL